MTDAEYQFELGRAYDKGYREAEALFMSMCSRDGVCGCHRWWHYPSKGEYPPEGEWVLVIAKDKSTVSEPGKWVMKYFAKSDNYLRSDNYFANNTYSIYASKVKCWQYIVPPKEEE